jgi:hypothetical protein
MNNYIELYETVIEGFLKNGFEIYHKSSWITILRRWKLVHQTEDLKIIDTVVNIIFDETEGAEQILVRYNFYEK